MSPSRIDELRRRVQNDPASIAFAQLAEEYRRAGQTDEAVRICRDGLTRHPGYLSARVTLGRALLDLGELGEARGEFEFVVAEAPENLAAVRGLAEISHREGQTAEALTYYQRALALSRHDPEIEEIVQQLSRQVGAASGPSNGLSFEEAHQELLSAAERVPLAPAPAVPAATAVGPEGSTAPFDFDRLVAALGTPTAPPQFEAAVTGHAAVAPIELPEPVDLGPNPFAALEAELRAHEPVPVEKPRPWDATPADETAAEATTWDLGTEPAVDLSPTPVAGDSHELAPLTEAVPMADADPAFAEALAAEPESLPQLAAEAAPAAALFEAVETITTPDAAFEPVEPSDAAPSLPPEDVLDDNRLSDPVEMLEASTAAPDEPSPIDALLAAPVPYREPRGAAALPVEGLADGPPLPTPAFDLDAAAPPAPSEPATAPAKKGDDVLGDLESWLNTLHDRSGD